MWVLRILGIFRAASREGVVINNLSRRAVVYSTCSFSLKEMSTISVSIVPVCLMNYFYLCSCLGSGPGSLVGHHGGSCLKMVMVMLSLEDQFSHTPPLNIVSLGIKYQYEIWREHRHSNYSIYLLYKDKEHI
jgi:hypothetical protein